jgi:hypothetical protein
MSTFDSSIVAYFGGDTAGIAAAVAESQTMVQQLDKRFSEMGISMGEAPKKFAEESAKAFQQVFDEQERMADEWTALKNKQATDEEGRIKKSAQASADVFREMQSAEEKLAAFRAEKAMRRLTAEEQMQTLWAQSEAIQTEIDAIEGQTVRKTELQLQQEQKKAQIYDIHQKTLRETVPLQEESAKNTNKQNVDLSTMEGLTKGIKKGFQDMGLALKGTGIGLAIAEFVSLGKEAIANAQKQRDEYEKMAKPLDGATTSMARFGDAIDGIKKGTVTAVGFVVGGFTQLGDLIGSTINRMRGINEAQESIAEQSERAAKAQEARANKLKEEQHDVERVAAARKAAADAEKQTRQEAMTDEQKFGALFMENVKIREQLRNIEAGTTAHFEKQRELQENISALRKADVAAVTKRAEAELAGIQQVGQLDITYGEKRATLEKERAALQAELRSLQKGTTEYAKAENDLRQKGIDLIKLDREWRKATTLDQAQTLELIKLEQKAKIGLTDAERARLSILRDQLKMNQLQYQIAELLEAKVTRGLTPAEEKRLKELFKQVDSLTVQIAQKEKLSAVVVDQTKSEANVTSEIRDQNKALQEQADLEKKITEEKARQQTFYGVARTDYNDESNEVIQARLLKNRTKIQELQEKSFGDSAGAFIYSYQIASLQNEINAMEQTLAARKNAARLDDLYGPVVGASMFPGDPKYFSQLAEMSRGQNVSAQITADKVSQIHGLLTDLLGRR